MIGRSSLLLMVLASAIVFGYTYGLDVTQALQVPFREEPYNFTTLQFNLMYVFTFMPIFLFNIPIGIIIDRNQVTKSLFCLLLFSTIAQLVSAWMVQFRISGFLIVMYIMRSFFGVAGQGIFTVQSMIITNYCQKQDFQLVLSMSLSIPFIFDSINSLVTTQIYNATGNASDPYYVSTGVCGLSIISGLLIYIFYIRSTRKEQIKMHQSSLLSHDNQGDDRTINLQENVEQKAEEQQSTFDLRQLKSFSKVFWVLMFACFITQISLGAFMDNLNDLLVKRLHIPYTHAGILLMIPFFGVSIFSVIFSIIMKKRPTLRRTFYVCSTALYLTSQLSLYFLPQIQEPAFLQYFVISFFCITLSTGYSIVFSGLQAAIPYVVDKKTIGTAYGVLGCVIGLSQSTMPFVNIAIINSDDQLAVSYRRLNLAYVIIAFVTVCLAVFMKHKTFEQLDTTFEKIKEYQEKLLKDDEKQVDAQIRI